MTSLITKKQRRSAAIRVGIRRVEKLPGDVWRLHLNCGHTKDERSASRPARLAVVCDFCVNPEKRAS